MSMMLSRLASILLLTLFFAHPLRAETAPQIYCATPKGENSPTCISRDAFADDLCVALERSAERYALDPHFFTRLIWRESRFNPSAISPVGAEGIAQFMPGTAKIRGLTNSFNPALALDASASYLSELKAEFGNVGLAAAAYNAGEERVRGFMTKERGLPTETINYVLAITDVPAERWRDEPPEALDLRLSKTEPFLPTCVQQAESRSVPEFRVAAPAAKPWGVQLGWHPTRSGASQIFRRVRAQHANVLGRESPIYIRSKMPGFGNRARYSVRVGRNTKTEAMALCNQIRSVGGVCTVARN
ncbi:lytic transglycosylase domain-containing protein [Paracoccaceae bacterium GXU_MW_L88]